jgi:hypothetical protein
MIALASDCLIFELASGESVPLSAEMISVEVAGDAASLFDAHFLQNSAHAVFHYFKYELGRQRVSLGEFSSALEKVLRSMALVAKSPPAPSGQTVLESDLRRLVSGADDGGELFFFPRLREELRHKLDQAPDVVRFSGLRQCVKRLAGVRRWTHRCRAIEEQVVSFLRECLEAERSKGNLALVVR